MIAPDLATALSERPALAPPPLFAGCALTSRLHLCHDSNHGSDRRQAVHGPARTVVPSADGTGQDPNAAVANALEPR